MRYVRFAPEDSRLVVVDVQEKLVAAMPAAAAAACVANAVRLVVGAAAVGVPVIVTEQYPKGLGPTVGALQEALAAHPIVTRVEKTEFDACDNGDFASLIDGDRGKFVIAGMESHICVAQTVRGLRARGRAVAVAQDATCSRTADNHRIGEGLARAAAALITSTEAVLFDWVGGATHPAFKTISRLVR